MLNLTELLNNKGHHYARSKALGLLKRKYDVTLDNESETNAKSVARYLTTNKDYFYILQSSHTSDADGRLLPLVHDAYIDPGLTRQVNAIVGDYRMAHDRMFRWKTVTLGRLVGYNMARVIQDYMADPKNRAQYGYTEDDIKTSGENISSWFHAIRDSGQAGVQNTYLSAPEGTRSNRLRDFGNDINYLRRLSVPYRFFTPGVVQTMVALFPGEEGVDWHKDSYNYGPVELRIAPGMITTRKRPVTIEDVMSSMASLIPDDRREMRGVWHDRLADWPPGDITFVEK